MDSDNTDQSNDVAKTAYPSSDSLLSRFLYSDAPEMRLYLTPPCPIPTTTSLVLPGFRRLAITESTAKNRSTPSRRPCRSENICEPNSEVEKDLAKDTGFKHSVVVACDDLSLAELHRTDLTSRTGSRTSRQTISKLRSMQRSSLDLCPSANRFSLSILKMKLFHQESGSP